MTGFDFFVDLTVTGTVLGLDHTSTPEAVLGVFGGEYTPPGQGFGLTEFGWYERKVTYFGAQVHRLRWLTRDDEVEPALVERYGAFPDRVDVDALREALAGLGFPLEEQAYHDEDYVDYRAPVSRMGVLAGRRSRDVVKMLGPRYYSPWERYPRQYDRFDSCARHLSPLSAGERAAWFDEHAEAHPDWWGCLAASAARVTAEDAGLRLAIHRAAVERGMYPADEAAVTEVGLLLDAGLEPDATVRAWLSTVTGVPDDVAGLRRLRDQIHEVEPALPRLTDPGLAAELRRWSTEKPRLLAG
jgi:hypothetical protein